MLKGKTAIILVERLQIHPFFLLFDRAADSSHTLSYYQPIREHTSTLNTITRLDTVRKLSI